MRPHPRSAFRPSFAFIIHPLSKSEGAGKTGWPLHPGLSRKKLRKERENLWVQAVTTGLPCAVVYGL